MICFNVMYHISLCVTTQRSMIDCTTTRFVHYNMIYHHASRMRNEIQIQFVFGVAGAWNFVFICECARKLHSYIFVILSYIEIIIETFIYFHFR